MLKTENLDWISDKSIIRRSSLQKSFIIFARIPKLMAPFSGGERFLRAPGSRQSSKEPWKACAAI
jgi:hypothetical protein